MATRSAWAYTGPQSAANKASLQRSKQYTASVVARQAANRQAASLAAQQSAARKASTQGSYAGLVASINRDRAAASQAKQTRSVISSISRGSAQARQANVARQSRIEGMYDEMLKSVGRGGAFEKAGLADIEEARTTGVGEETQSMISSGTYGTTTAAGIPGKHRKIATQARLKLEDVVAQRELGVKQQKAGFLERIEDTYPDYSQLLSSLAR